MTNKLVNLLKCWNNRIIWSSIKKQDQLSTYCRVIWSSVQQDQLSAENPNNRIIWSSIKQDQLSTKFWNGKFNAKCPVILNVCFKSKMFSEYWCICQSVHSFWDWSNSQNYPYITVSLTLMNSVHEVCSTDLQKSTCFRQSTTWVSVDLEFTR